MITILGGFGNMGTRYSQILKKRGVDHLLADINVPVDRERTTALIIATPSDSHMSDIERFGALPILCEKPISRYWASIDKMMLWKALGMNLTMIDQYSFIKKGKNDGSGETVYSSWHSGDDTLPWDCINIIAKANDLKKTRLSNKAPKPHWECKINGKPLSLSDMGKAYEDMLMSWVENPKSNNLEYIIKAHNRVWEFKKCVAST